MATAYDLRTGEILAAGEIEHMRDVQGIGYDARASHNPADGYYTQGEFREYSREQRAVKQQRARSSYWRWSNERMQWEDLRTLDEHKAKHWAQIKAARDAAEFGSFDWDGSRFDSDALAQARIMGAVQMAVLAAAAGQQFAIDWTLQDNTVRTLTGSDMIAVGLALGAHVGRQHAIGRQLRARVMAATTAAEVAQIVWPS